MFEDELIDKARVIEIRKEVTDVLYREKHKQRHAFLQSLQVLATYVGRNLRLKLK